MRCGQGKAGAANPELEIGLHSSSQCDIAERHQTPPSRAARRAVHLALDIAELELHVARGQSSSEIAGCTSAMYLQQRIYQKEMPPNEHLLKSSQLTGNDLKRP
jgi:hypothetical protein